MKIKDKFAAFLRRIANRVSPAPELLPHNPDGLTLPSSEGSAAYYKVRRVAIKYKISRREEQEAMKAQQFGYDSAVERMREEYRERVAHSIVAALRERDIVEYTEDRDPYTGELMIGGSLYVGIRDNIDNINPFNQ